MSSPVKAGRAISTLVAAILALLPLLSGSCAAADAWPNRPVHFIVTLGPGSGVDIGARLLPINYPRVGVSQSPPKIARVVMAFAASIAQQREQVATVAKLFGNKPVQ